MNLNVFFMNKVYTKNNIYIQRGIQKITSFWRNFKQYIAQIRFSFTFTFALGIQPFITVWVAYNCALNFFYWNAFIFSKSKFEFYYISERRGFSSENQVISTSISYSPTAEPKKEWQLDTLSRQRQDSKSPQL